MTIVHIHIGLPKTGSSAVQAFMAQNAAALQARGLHVPAIGEFAVGAQGRISSGNGALLARSLRPPGREGAIADGAGHVAAFQAALAAAPTPAVAISSELFLSGDDGEDEAVLTRLRDLAREAGAAPRVVCALREQVSFLCAHYIQRVKRHGLTEAPEPFVARAAGALGFLRYAALHRMLERVFGPGAVRACVYDIQRDRPEGLIGGIMALMGVDARGLPRAAAPLNVSLGASQLALMRMLNRFAPRMRLSDVLAAEAATRGGPGAAAETLLPPGQRAEIRAAFAAGNAQAARRMFGRETLFPPSPAAAAPHRPLDAARIDAEEAARSLGALIVDLDRRLHALELRADRDAGRGDPAAGGAPR